MSDERHNPQPELGHLLIGLNRDPSTPPAQSTRKKRRRTGQLNDGEWAPGYGPNAKKGEASHE